MVPKAQRLRIYTFPNAKMLIVVDVPVYLHCTSSPLCNNGEMNEQQHLFSLGPFRIADFLSLKEEP